MVTITHLVTSSILRLRDAVLRSRGRKHDIGNPLREPRPQAQQTRISSYVLTMCLRRTDVGKSPTRRESGSGKMLERDIFV